MIPTYNGYRYLRQALGSVLAQDPGSEAMQIQVVDDCSDEGAPEAITRELGDGRVEFHRHARRLGHPGNLNACIERSSGRLVHILHDDDYVRPGFYRTMEEGFDNPAVGAAFCRHIYMDERGHWETISLLERDESGVIDGWLRKIAGGQRLAAPSMVVRREVYERLGDFDRRISCAGEDWEMWVRIAAHYPVWFETKPLAAYRLKRPGSLTAQAVRSGAMIRDMRIATEIVETLLEACGAGVAAEEARRTFAAWALEGAQFSFRSGEYAHARAQLREGMKLLPRVSFACRAGGLLVREGLAGVVKKGSRNETTGG